MHVDKQAHAVNDPDGAAAIVAPLEACGAKRVAVTRGGRGVLTKRADTDQVPRLTKAFQASSKLWR